MDNKKHKTARERKKGKGIKVRLEELKKQKRNRN